jgi:hypothetical protein
MLILVPYVLPEQNLSGKNPRCGINTSKAAEDSAKVSVRVYELIWICILWISISHLFLPPSYSRRGFVITLPTGWRFSFIID